LSLSSENGTPQNIFRRAQLDEKSEVKIREYGHIEELAENKN